MIVVGDVVEIDQAADDVVLKPRFLDAALAASARISSCIRAQVLDPSSSDSGW